MSRSLALALALAVAGAGLVAWAPPPGRCGATYEVVRGDTLSAIARRCRSSVAAIARASGVANPDLILVGQRLTIPDRSARASAPTRPATAADSGYAMARGDTLFSLARWADVSLASLIAANPGIDPHRIETGERVRLPAGARDPLALRTRERGRGGPLVAPRRPGAPPVPLLPDEPRETIGM